MLRLVLDGLSKQSYKNFEIVIVMKPSNDGTDALVEQYGRKLKIRKFLQGKGHFTDALNIGLKHASGDVIGFIDDDAIPAVDWLEKHCEAYWKFGVSGVAGDVVSATLDNGKVESLIECAEPPFHYPLSRFTHVLWDKPLPGAEGYSIYLARSGYIGIIGNMAYWRRRGSITRSFLGMGANMSVLREAISGFAFRGPWVTGAGGEQILAWHLWKNGLKMIFYPEARVFHIIHGQTLSRALLNKKRALFRAEFELLFYRLYGKERALSNLHHMLSVFYRIAVALKERDLPTFDGIVRGNLIGCKWVLFRNLARDDTVLHDLEAIAYA